MLHSSNILNLLPMIHFDWLEPVSSVGYVPQKYQFLSNSFCTITQSPEITFLGTATAPGSEFLFPVYVVHLARRRLDSAPTSKSLFWRRAENVSRFESFTQLFFVLLFMFFLKSQDKRLLLFFVAIQSYLYVVFLGRTATKSRQKMAADHEQKQK